MTYHVETLAPTYSCFADVASFLAHLDPIRLHVHRHEFTVVHARCSFNGQVYAHAWVEAFRMRWQAAIAHGKGFKPRRLFYAVHVDDPVGFTVEREWRYTLTEAFEESRRSDDSGPWIAELLELTHAADARRERGESQVVGSLELELKVIDSFFDEGLGRHVEVPRNEIVGGDPDGGR